MKKMTFKLVMAVTCFGMMAGDAVAQERGGANGVKVLSAVNARREQLVNSVANEIRAPSVVNARREQLANSVANGVRAVSYTHLTLPTNREV